MLKKNPRWIELDADRDYLLRMLSTRQRDGALIAELNAVNAELANTPMMIDSKMIKPIKVAKVRSVKVAKADIPPKVWVPKTIKDIRPPKPMRNYKAVLTDANDIQYKLVMSRVRGCPTHRHFQEI
jgi:hypothetical protein